MANDSLDDRFDAAVAELDTAMVVVATAAGGERSGCLVGFHCQASIDPLRYAVWISRANHTFGLIDECTHMTVHLVNAEDDAQVALAIHFGSTTGDEIDKFAGLAVSDGPGAAPLLADLPDRFVGRKVAVLDAPGDHVGVLLEPVEAEAGTVEQTLRFSRVADVDAGHSAD